MFTVSVDKQPQEHLYPSKIESDIFPLIFNTFALQLQRFFGQLVPE